MRASLALVASCLLAGLAAGPARADAPRTDYVPGVAVDPAAPAPANGTVSNIIFLNRCTGGCSVRQSNTNDSIANQTWLGGGPENTTYHISAYQYDDAHWQQIVDCVKDVYSPYNVVVTDVDPGASTPHTTVYAAGSTTELMINAGGVGGPKTPFDTGCQAVDNNVAFAFLNDYPANAVEYVCGVIAQESGHSFGMPDHVRDCRDPMSYSYYGPCSSSKRGYFRNTQMKCGNFGDGVCICGGESVSTHSHLMEVFGASGTNPPAPTVQIVAPAPSSQIQSNTVFGVTADAVRGIWKVELYLNGWLWATYNTPSHLGPQDTWPLPSYLLDPPDTFPDGKYDVEVRVYDDIGTMSSATEQVVKGAPCSDASTCAKGQTCDSGKCEWAAPSGQVGDACSYDQFCVGPNTYDGQCVQLSSGQSVCTTSCVGAPNDSCPTGTHCDVTDTAHDSGLCVPDVAPAGCCSTTDAPAAGPLGLGAAVAALLARRRRSA